MKHIVLCLCLAAVGCADTLPSDTLTRFANTLESLRYAYFALCTDRESASECVVIRENVNAAVDRYTALNDSLKGEP